MKFTIEQSQESMETLVIIRCHDIDASVNRLIRFLKAPEQNLIGEIDKEMHLLKPDKIFYVESVDNKIFIYGEKEVYESRKKLYDGLFLCF